jgi:diguanylate cyclase (GGDEF)-like protein
MSIDRILWQWSTVAQLISGLMIAGFFVAFRASFRTREVQAWTRAWLANLVALFITDIYWFAVPTGAAVIIVRLLYMAAKFHFVAYLIEGTLAALGHDRAPWSARARTIVLVGLSAIAALTVSSLDALGIATHSLVTIALASTMVVALRGAREHHLGWLSVGLGLRALVAGVETVMYAANATPPLLTLPLAPDTLARLLAVSSSFDTVAEWLLALGCVLAVTGRAQRELERTNSDLREAQETLRAMVDVDPLTGLANRRALPAILRAVQPAGAALVFFDLRGFKEINDVRGHHAGDEALRRFANALRETFRPADHVVRFAGDEFVVLTQGLDRMAMQARVEGLRARLGISGPGLARIQFDAGHAELEPGGMPDEALRAADLAMYEAKELARRAAAPQRR